MNRFLKFLIVAACVYPTAALATLPLLGAGGPHVAAANGMTTPVLSSFNPPTSGTTTFFMPPVGSSSVDSILSGATTAARVPIPIAGTIKGLSANLNTAQNTATPASITDNINGTNGTVTCAFTASAAPFSCNDHTHSDSVAAGSLMQWSLSPGTGPWAQTANVPEQVSFLFTAASGQQSMILSGPTNSNIEGTITAFFVGFGTSYTAATLEETEINSSSISPSAFVANSLYVIPNGTENTVPHVYTVFHNGVATSLTCTAAASSTGGCCVNLTGSGTIGASGPACTTAAGTVTVAVGDTLSVEIACSSGACGGVAPGISVGIVPSVTNQVPLMAQWDLSTPNDFVGFEDNSLLATPISFQLIPQLSSGSMTFSNMIACTAVNPGSGATRTLTSESATAPNVTPTAPSGGTAVTLSVANGACPGANSGVLLAGSQDTTHTWTAGAGNVVINSLGESGSAAASTVWKTGMVVTVP
jgi:hypothetical protein